MIGSSLKHYCIVEKLGEGGMGVVYKARDTHLDRFVAIKVLPAEQVADPERKRRFVQEAKAASALNHPNIIHIYDIDQSDGIDFIAMEYVAGKTLDGLIPKRGMRLSEALKYAVPIADALARAHGAGIIHRDLKPSNVMVSEHGLVKVLDFGLAKLIEAVSSDEETAVTRTGAGTVLGTAAYMSPEQAEGKHLDTRSDIFSFGSMLYEMLTGERAFRGDTRASTIASVLREEPKPLSQAAGGLPREVERVVRRCLRKDPESRFQTMADLRVALEELREESDSGALEATPAATTSRHYRTVVALGMAVALLAIILVPISWYFSHWKGDPARRPPRIVPLTSFAGWKDFPKFSPDGKFVAFEWDGPAHDNRDIYVKQLGSGGQIRITSDPAWECCPVWSPDGSEIAFVRFADKGAAIHMMPSIGGVERKLYDFSGLLQTDVGQTQALTWSPDGRSLAFAEKPSPDAPARIYLLLLTTREKRPLTSPPSASWGDCYPEFSPDGARIAFMRASVYGSCDLWTQAVSSIETTRVTREGYRFMGRPAWTADGRELVFPAGPGSNRLLRVSASGGTPELVAGIGENVGSATISGMRLVYLQHSNEARKIWRRRSPRYEGRDAAAAPLMESTRDYRGPDYSPDGRRIAFEWGESGSSEIWICDSDGSKPVQLTYLQKISGSPRWSPDGKRIVFDSRPGDDSEIYVISADGGAPQRRTNDKSDDTVPSWSRDGQWIYFTSNRGGKNQVWRIPSEGGTPVQVTKGGGHYSVESFDGRIVYYTKPGLSNTSGPIWKVPWDGGEESPVLDTAIDYSCWALRPEGIYFFTPGYRRFTIEFFSFATRRTTSFFQEEIPHYPWALAISPDGQWLLYGDIPPRTSDLMLVENFR